MAARISFAAHVGGIYLRQLQEREDWIAKVRACGFDVDELLAEADRIAAESTDETIATPRPALTDRQARAIAWAKAIRGAYPVSFASAASHAANQR